LSTSPALEIGASAEENRWGARSAIRMISAKTGMAAAGITLLLQSVTAARAFTEPLEDYNHQHSYAAGQENGIE